jgi:guanosine-3',5'-bis(diphosphate) 3'-pyrophosphohydrolase
MYAAFKHRHQVRKASDIPYISHPFRVAMTVRHVFGCEESEVIAAALLHDLIEDTTTDYEDLSERFGSLVADLVAAMTKNAALPEDRRESEYDAQLARADWRARLLKLADTYDNLCDSIVSPGNGEVTLTSSLERARRALAIAAQDAANPISAQASAALTALVKGAGARNARIEHQP